MYLRLCGLGFVNVVGWIVVVFMFYGVVVLLIYYGLIMVFMVFGVMLLFCVLVFFIFGIEMWKVLLEEIFEVN